MRHNVTGRRGAWMYLGVADRGGLVEVALPLANTSLSLNPNRLTAIIQWAGLAKGV
jgi:hypothetical protein